MEQVKAIPHGMHTITPHLVCAGAADAIDFYKKAFNAREVSRAAGVDGQTHRAGNHGHARRLPYLQHPRRRRAQRCGGSFAGW